MSGPNTSYDPVQVTPLNVSVDAMVAEALAAFAAATSMSSSNRPGWHMPRTARRSPSPTGRSVPCRLQARKEVGARVGRARGTINEALKAREEEIKAAEVARILVDERVDVTLPVQTQPVGAQFTRSPR